MSKAGLKSFVYSFSVSLFAIVAAHRTFWHVEPLSEPPLNISNKNIVLFLKDNTISKSPTKRIALNSLPDINVEPLTPPSVQPEIILADSLEDIDFPLEEETKPEAQIQQLALADILYAPEMIPDIPKIDAEPIYAPEKSDTPELKAPQPTQQKKHEIKIAVKDDTVIYTPDTAAKSNSADEQAVLQARNATTENFPLQKSSTSVRTNKINIGNPKDLNHVALDKGDVSIHSMENDLEQASDTKEWKQQNDNPWIVAKSNGLSRNQMAKKDFADKSQEEISQALTIAQNREGVQVASETVKNLIIPIPGEIMEDKNLTPKLAYPSSSEDAEKEKVINEALKKKDNEASAEPQALLSPIEEDVTLDAPAPITPITAPVETAVEQTPSQPIQNMEEKSKEPTNGGIMNALNSIFTASQKKLAEAKDKAFAKAEAKRSFRKRLAKSRPVSIMPTEIRLSFQPNRAEISGQTLRWVQAFASKAAEASNIALEIRIDGTSSVSLQQKRLNLLHNILTNKGVEHSKINTVFTTREPNSFILRTINLKNNNSGENTGKKNSQAQGNYIQW